MSKVDYTSLTQSQDKADQVISRHLSMIPRGEECLIYYRDFILIEYNEDRVYIPLTGNSVAHALFRIDRAL